MIFLIFALIGIGVGVYQGYREGDGPLGFLLALLFGILGTLLAFVIWIGALLWLPSHDVAARYDLVSLKDAAGIDGAFFLGSGAIGSTLNDTWYQREADGSYTGHEADTDRVRVFQDSPAIPYLKQYHGELDWKFAAWLFPIPDGAANKKRVYEFHIPKDSIKPGFVLTGGQ
jgi:hypothetical protein